MKFLYEHSLSITLTVGWAANSWLAWYVAREENNFMYDWSLSNAGSFGGSAILVILATKLWEKDSTPDKPPRK